MADGPNAMMFDNYGGFWDQQAQTPESAASEAVTQLMGSYTRSADVYQAAAGI